MFGRWKAHHLQQDADWLTGTERAPARQHDITEQALSQVHVCPVDRINNDLVHARVLFADELGVEEDLGREEAFRAELDWSTSLACGRRSSQCRTMPRLCSV